jgi:hypothetical protein
VDTLVRQRTAEKDVDETVKRRRRRTTWTICLRELCGVWRVPYLYYTLAFVFNDSSIFNDRGNLQPAHNQPFEYIQITSVWLWGQISLVC